MTAIQGVTVDKHTLDEWVEIVCTDLSKSAQGAIAAGQHLAQAKAQHASKGTEKDKTSTWSEYLVKVGLSRSTADKLMSIGANRALAAAVGSMILPSNWTTLYELSQAPEDELALYLTEHPSSIRPETTGSAARGIAAALLAQAGTPRAVHPASGDQADRREIRQEARRELHQGLNDPALAAERAALEEDLGPVAPEPDTPDPRQPAVLQSPSDPFSSKPSGIPAKAGPMSEAQVPFQQAEPQDQPSEPDPELACRNASVALLVAAQRAVEAYAAARESGDTKGPDIGQDAWATVVTMLYGLRGDLNLVEQAKAQIRKANMAGLYWQASR